MLTSKKTTQGEELKILAPEQILQRLPMVLAQVKTGKTEDLFHEIWQIAYSAYQPK